MSKNTEIYELVIDRLVSAQYGFGERLLVKELAAETGASRQPIMSAINRLSAEGFVRIIPQVGCEVISPGPEEIADFFLLFQRIEGLLAELAARRRIESDLLELSIAQQRLIAHIASSAPSPPIYLQLNQAFHRTVYEIARSPLLGRKQRNNFNMSDFFITHSVGFGALMPNAPGEHDQIIDAIRARDGDGARQEAEAHIGAVAEAVLSSLSARRT